jgi:acetyl esterase/lipase
MVATVTAVTAQPIEVEVWPQGAPTSNGITTPEEGSNTDRVSNVSSPRMYVHLPQSKAQPTAAVVICPGGGYSRLAMDHEGHQLAQWLCEQGVAGVVLKYRMPNGHHEVPLSDAQQALRLVRSHAKAWNIAPNKVGIAGASAGGHLASTALTHFADSASHPSFGILFYPVVSMDSVVSHGGSRKLLLGEKPAAEMGKFYSNEQQVSAQTPPTILVLSDDDKTVLPRNSVDFYAALKRYKVPAAIYIFPTGGHGWGMKPSFAYHEQLKDLLRAWLKERGLM